MATTIARIAHDVGMSTCTVSRILNNQHQQYRPETRDKVLEAAKRLGYRCNAFARATRVGRTNFVAMLMSTTPERSYVTPAFLSAIHEALYAHGMRLTVSMLPDNKLADADYVPQILREWSADGLLVTYDHAYPPRMVALLEKSLTPAIWTNTKRPVNCVFPDEYHAGRLATQHLVELGHTSIAYVDFAHGEAQLDQAHYSARDRLAGYRSAMRDALLAPQIVMHREVRLNYTERTHYAVCALARSDRPTALVTYGDTIALPCAFAAAQLGISIPDDLSIVTIDDEPCSRSGLFFTTIIIDRVEIARRAVEHLLLRIKAPEYGIPSSRIPPSVVMGATSSRPPAS